MNKLVSIFFFLLPALILAQERQLFKGKAIADMMTVENLTVKNTSANTLTITDSDGDFSINAMAGDILEFSSPTFKTLFHSLKANDFKEELFVIRVEPSAIVLDEVQLNGLTGVLAIDSKRIKVDRLFNSEFDAAKINLNVVNENPLGNLNFIALFGMLYKAIFPGTSKNSTSRIQYAPVVHKAFSKVLLEYYPESFFTETVCISREKLVLFLHFCNNDAKRYLLDPKNEAELIIYLKKKYAQYINQIQADEN